MEHIEKFAAKEPFRLLASRQSNSHDAHDITDWAELGAKLEATPESYLPNGADTTNSMSQRSRV